MMAALCEELGPARVCCLTGSPAPPGAIEKQRGRFYRRPAAFRPPRWRKAGAWDRRILAVGGITSAARARAALDGGASAALVATAALVDPLFAVRFR